MKRKRFSEADRSFDPRPQPKRRPGARVNPQSPQGRRASARRGIDARAWTAPATFKNDADDRAAHHARIDDAHARRANLI
jgi:hypothetical protein